MSETKVNAEKLKQNRIETEGEEGAKWLRNLWPRKWQLREELGRGAPWLCKNSNRKGSLRPELPQVRLPPGRTRKKSLHLSGLLESTNMPYSSLAIWEIATCCIPAWEVKKSLTTWVWYGNARMRQMWASQLRKPSYSEGDAEMEGPQCIEV